MTTITIAVFDDSCGFEPEAQYFDFFSGATLREAAMALLATVAGGEGTIPDAIPVYSGKAYITEYDGDRFWITLICNILGDGSSWGYGSSREEAMANAIPAFENE